jgi:hypothetical protein
MMMMIIIIIIIIIIAVPVQACLKRDVPLTDSYQMYTDSCLTIPLASF